MAQNKTQNDAARDIAIQAEKLRADLQKFLDELRGSQKPSEASDPNVIEEKAPEP